MKSRSIFIILNLFSIILSLLGSAVTVTPANASNSVAAPYLFSAGSLIIPMDIDTNGQDMGMLRAYGLVYELLRNNITVHWAIDSDKSANGDDFTISSIGNALESFETSTPITLPRSYRGGPFVIADTDADAALPIIQAWQATAGDNTEVHRLASGSFTFITDVAYTLINAPRIAIIMDGNEATAFDNLNAAGIPDSSGGAWGYSSPDLLTESQMAGPTTTDHADGALLHQPSDLTRYCYIASMHYNDTVTTTEVVQEVRSWLTGTTLTHAYMQCESISVFENDPSGHFLTTAGLNDQTDGTLIPVNRAPYSPLSQIDGTFENDSGSTDWFGPATSSTFKTGVDSLFTKELAVANNKIILLSGRMDGALAGNGQVTYLGGHDYTLDLPISTHEQTNGVRIFLNSIFASGCATNPSQADMTLTLSAPTTTDTDQITYTINYSNPGPRPVENVTITNVLPPNTTYISATIVPTSTAGGILTWDLPALASGANGSISFTVNVAGDLSYSNTASVQFAHLTVHNISSNTVTTLVGIPTVLSHTLQSIYPGTGPNTIAVTFSNNVNDPAGNSDIDDVTNPNNYFIIEKGTNGIADTISCVAAVQSDDALTLPASVNYIPNTAILSLNTALPTGNYRLFVCGTSSIVNPALVPLAGDGVTSGTDFTFDFTVGITTAPTTGGNSDSITASALPSTGFAPNKITSLPVQPSTSSYSNLGDISLEIPSLNVKTTIVGVPQNEDNSWNVNWLGNETGWLNGTAFPTWVGNSVLTAHVTNADGLPGPFANLKDLKYSDQIIVHLFDQQYIFEIQNSRMVRPYTTNFAFASLQDHSYLTLITCQGYIPFSDTYLFRRVVRAVLVDVK